MSRPYFESVRAYGARFTDADYWKPYVREVLQRHSLDGEGEIRIGLPGTHPVFLVGNRWAVKFFSDFFSGDRSHAVERECSFLLEQIPEFPAPRLVADGALFDADDGWHWPYLVSTLLPGGSFGDVYDEVTAEERAKTVRSLGVWLKRLHFLPREAAVVLRPDWGPFLEWLAERRAACSEDHRNWRSLSTSLLAQLDDYLPPVETLVQRSTPPLLLHGDMNADHLLGSLQEGRWTSAGIIDFGDARIGDLLYELVALHLGFFRCDKTLLQTFLEAYDSDAAAQPDFVQRAMSFTLLHECNVVGELFDSFPELSTAQTLEELAHWLWNPANANGADSQSSGLMLQ